MLDFKRLNLFYIFLSSIFAFLYNWQILMSMNESSNYNQTLYRLILIFLWGFSTLYLFINIKNISSFKSPLVKLFSILLFLLVFLNSVMSDPMKTPAIAFFKGMSITLPLIVFLCFYGVFKKSDYGNLLPKIFIPLFIGLILIYYREYNFIKSTLELENKSYNSAYIPLFVLPIILCLNKKWLKISSILLIGLVILSSNKRGGFIAFLLSILVYLLIELSHKQKRSFFRKIVYLLVFLGLGLKTYNYFDEKNEGFFTYRLEKLQEDGGSGRIGIYLDVIKGLEKARIENIILGHGENSVAKITQEKLSAHNDFLEILYNYGFFTFLIYISIIYYLFLEVKVLIKSKNVFASSMAMSLVLFLILSLISHVFIYQFFIFLTIFWGAVIGTYDRNKEDKLLLKRNKDKNINS